jgi:hypothetical protein
MAGTVFAVVHLTRVLHLYATREYAMKMAARSNELLTGGRRYKVIEMTVHDDPGLITDAETGEVY